MNIEPTQAETIAALSLRCDGPDQAEKFDRAVRASLSVSKEAVLKEEARQKKIRAGRRAKKAWICTPSYWWTENTAPCSMSQVMRIRCPARFLEYSLRSKRQMQRNLKTLAAHPPILTSNFSQIYNYS
jgi:hypothetical protein